MAFKGRTVLALLILAMFAGSILTLTVANSFDLSTIADERNVHKDNRKADRSASGSSTDAEKKKGGLTAEQMEKMNTTLQIIESRYISDVDRETLIDGAINGMLETLNDPYTVYMDAKEAKNFLESVDSSFSGIGAEVTMDEGRVTVIAPIKGSPAERAGVHAKDVILSVNGEKLEGLKLNEAVMKIRGPKGTQAKLDILRPGSVEAIQIIVVRDDIDIETVYAEMMEGNIGKIEIRQFAQHTAQRFNEELKQLEAKGMQALIIDVRNDPGGYLFGVLEILDPLVPEGKTLVQIEYRNQKRERKIAAGPGKPYPIAVLINKGSASASEILAGALSESVGSTLIGETTYGKGTVQTPFDKEFGDGSSIKMTIAKWLTPNGNWINEKGIAPHIAVEQPAYYRAGPLPKDKVIKLDDIGDEVKNLQLMLQGLGLVPGRTDGYFSETTQVAVKAFQRLNDLPVTGEVDSKTAEKIEQGIVKEILNPKNDNQLNAAVQHLKNKLSK
jgi:carboxyl-terminal processing protease